MNGCFDCSPPNQIDGASFVKSSTLYISLRTDQRKGVVNFGNEVGMLWQNKCFDLSYKTDLDNEKFTYQVPVTSFVQIPAVTNMIEGGQ